MQRAKKGVAIPLGKFTCRFSHTGPLLSTFLEVYPSVENAILASPISRNENKFFNWVSGRKGILTGVEKKNVAPSHRSNSRSTCHWEREPIHEAYIDIQRASVAGINLAVCIIECLIV